MTVRQSEKGEMTDINHIMRKECSLSPTHFTTYDTHESQYGMAHVKSGRSQCHYQ